jgi:arginine N-succinyltransferase
LAGRFFGLTFPEADEFNAVHGTRFIADLMPKTPIYVDLLADSAKAVMGQPHPSGRAALRMLEHEGFVFDRYIDIFDGGPTMTVATDRVRTVRDAGEAAIETIGIEHGQRAILSAGRLGDFRATLGEVSFEGGLGIDEQAAAALDVRVGDAILHAVR